MAQFIDQLFCPNMRGLLIVKIRLREVAGSIPDELRFFIIILGQYCTGQLYLSAVFYPLPYVKIGLREGRGIESRRAQIFLLFWDSTGQLYMSAVLREDPKGSDCGRVAGSIPDELRFFIILYCTGQLSVSVSRDRFPTSSDFVLYIVQGSFLYLSALRARKIYIRYPPY